MFSFATVLEHILVWRLVNILEIRYIAAVILLMPCVKRVKMLLVFCNTSAWVEWYEHTYFVCSPMKMVLKYSKIMSINHYFLDILGTRATLKFPHKLKAALNCIYRKGMGRQIFLNVLRQSFLFFTNFMIYIGRFCCTFTVIPVKRVMEHSHLQVSFRYVFSCSNGYFNHPMNISFSFSLGQHN